MAKISILIPAHNEEEALPLTFRRISAVIDSMPEHEWEILVVDDGSTDRTCEVVMKLREEDSRINLLSLSRNFGKEAAMLAGIDHVSGDATLIMDADGQHPVEMLPEMLRYWEEGYDDVYAVRRKRDTDSRLRRQLSIAFYRILDSASESEVLLNAGDFRLLDRSCVKTLSAMRESKRYTKGLYSWMGYRKKALEYDPGERVAGNTNYPMHKLFALAADGLTSSTTRPLKLATYTGSAIALLAFIYIIYLIIKTLIYGEPVRGFPTLMSAILFLGGTQLLTIGIMGEYIGRIFIESKHRPPYVADRFNGEKIRK